MDFKKYNNLIDLFFEQCDKQDKNKIFLSKVIGLLLIVMGAIVYGGEAYLNSMKQRLNKDNLS